MIDLHSHIIPGIDDGAGSWEEAIAMCRMAWEDGTKTLAATPHVFNGVYQSEGALVTGQIAILEEKLEVEGIGLTLVQGAEVYSVPDLPLILHEEPKFTFNEGKRYFLLEFPHTTVPPHADQLIFQLQICHFVPIIAHPERNLYFQRNPESLERLLDQGAFSQVTAMSFTGGFGERARECAYELLRRNMVHAVASDAHNMKSRPPLLSQARKAVREYAGEKKAQELFELFPQMVLSGEPSCFG